MDICHWNGVTSDWVGVNNTRVPSDVNGGEEKSMAEQRLIDANAILYSEAVDGDTFEGTGKLYARKEDIDALPTIEERKTGKWLPDNTNMYEIRFVCSNCKESQVVPTIGYKPIWDWCPNCGADMREQP